MEQKKVEAPIPTPMPEPQPPKKEINLFASDTSYTKSAFDEEPEEVVFSKPVGLVKSATEATKPPEATFKPVTKQMTQKESDLPPIGGGLPAIGGGFSMG